MKRSLSRRRNEDGRYFESHFRSVLIVVPSLERAPALPLGGRQRRSAVEKAAEGRKGKRERGWMMLGNPPPTSTSLRRRHQFTIGSSFEQRRIARHPSSSSSLLFTDKVRKRDFIDYSADKIACRAKTPLSVDVACLRRIPSFTVLSSSECHLRRRNHPK